MLQPPKLGLITVGQGPRDEFVAYHRNLLQHLGVAAQIEMRHGLEGLTRDEMRTLEALPGEACISGRIHEAGASRDRLPQSLVRVRSAALTPRFQACIDDLEAAGVSATILCCAEEYPPDTFRAARPFILPWLAMVEGVRVATLHMPAPRIGVLVLDEEHLAQNITTWSTQPWMRRLQLFFELWTNPIDQALCRLRDRQVQMVLIWGYGVGTAPGDPPGLIETVEAITGAPLLTAHAMSTLLVRHFLRPSMPDHDFGCSHPAGSLDATTSGGAL